jgi:hypothetical protein
MPYFVYRVGSLGVLTKLGEFAAFREASAHAKQLRSADSPGGGGRIKVMFADNELAAEDQLSQVRERPPMTGDDD